MYKVKRIGLATLATGLTMGMVSGCPRGVEDGIELYRDNFGLNLEIPNGVKYVLLLNRKTGEVIDITPNMPGPNCRGDSNVFGTNFSSGRVGRTGYVSYPFGLNLPRDDEYRAIVTRRGHITGVDERPYRKQDRGGGR